MTDSDDQRLDAYDYDLPADRIAQRPAPERSSSRLLEVPRRGPLHLAHHIVRDLPQLLRGDELLVFNDARVVPARLRGHKVPTGGAVELLALNAWEPGARFLRAIVRTSKTLKLGGEVRVGEHTLRVHTSEGGGRYAFTLPEGVSLLELLETSGELPLPPYIGRQEGPDTADADRYQTLFASTPGAAAAPTAGLHFDEPLLAAIRARGCDTALVTLHVGLGTFLPVRVDDLTTLAMHAERLAVPEATADAVARAKAEGRPVLAVGTTVVRALEGSAAASPHHRVTAGELTTELFLRPGSTFHVVDQLLTNFHLPKSTLLMLVSAFAGRTRILKAYAAAVEAGYRFFSYGDAMVIR